MLNDRTRLTAFRAAIAELVQLGDIVIAFDPGFGILAMIAASAGAGRVYAIASGRHMELNRQITRANAFDDRITWLRPEDLARLPVKADIAVSDEIGCFGFEGGIVEKLLDARRFLAADAIVVPSTLRLHVAPIECSEIHRRIAFWAGPQPAGLNFSSAIESAVNTGYPIDLRADDILGQPATVASLDLARLDEQNVGNRTEFTITRDGILHGIGGWFSAELSRSIAISNSPLAGQPLDQACVVMPIAEPAAVTSGDRVATTIRIGLANRVVSWTVEIANEAGERKARFAQSTFRGMLLQRADLHQITPTSVPRLDPGSQVCRTVMNLCDGTHSFESILDKVESGHPGLFASRLQAAVFVASIVRRHTKEIEHAHAGEHSGVSQRRPYQPPVLFRFDGIAELAPGMVIDDHEMDFGGV
jgi:hypothetical protein